MQSEQALQVQALQTQIDSELIRLNWSDSESAIKMHSILISSLRRSMNRISNATCVVNKNRNSESATMTRERLISSLSLSLNSESAWTTFKIKFNHESFFICIFYDLSLFTTLTTTERCVTNVLDSISTSSNSIESVMTLSLVEFRIARSHDYFVIYLFIYLVIFFLHFFAFTLFITFINWV